MPFDYNSFLKGVITGMQLPRTPGRITPPQPPVPSNRYMITEIDEDDMITESGDYMVTE